MLTLCVVVCNQSVTGLRRTDLSAYKRDFAGPFEL